MPPAERRFNSYYAEFLPASREELRPHAHHGVEFIYALSGTLNIQIGADDCARGGRLDILRLEHPSRVQPPWRADVTRHRGHGRGITDPRDLRARCRRAGSARTQVKSATAMG